MLELLTVTLNIPKLVPMVRTHFNIFFRRHFPHDHNTTTLLWARTVRPVYPETGSCSSPDHPACSRDKPADSPDHPTKSQIIQPYTVMASKWCCFECFVLMDLMIQSIFPAYPRQLLY